MCMSLFLWTVTEAHLCFRLDSHFRVNGFILWAVIKCASPSSVRLQSLTHTHTLLHHPASEVRTSSAPAHLGPSLLEPEGRVWDSSSHTHAYKHTQGYCREPKPSTLSLKPSCYWIRGCLTSRAVWNTPSLHIYPLLTALFSSEKTHIRIASNILQFFQFQPWSIYKL